MPSSQSIQPPRGEYRRGGSSDLRAPCPVLNSLANHGLIARDGRNITKDELIAALHHIGLARGARNSLCDIAFKIHTDDDKDSRPGRATLGFREPGQLNEDGVPVLNLDQVGRPHSMEHDVSLSREDRALGDCMPLDVPLYKNLLACPRKKKAFRIWDLGRYRKVRYNEQKRNNPQLKFGMQQHISSCLEVAAIQCVFGTGLRSGVPMEFVDAVFGEERLPYQEGWSPRRSMLFVELIMIALCVSFWAWPFSMGWRR
ncbi:Chloroperoxidase [Aspergillus ambiguus]|uniref:Chloroperoxidase n=1 Tax=Aspergillus ambiguus TaxID=176160 RepID=UPI003CCCD135